jgi:hypothetical protein
MIDVQRLWNVAKVPVCSVFTSVLSSAVVARNFIADSNLSDRIFDGVIVAAAGAYVSWALSIAAGRYQKSFKALDVPLDEVRAIEGVSWKESYNSRDGYSGKAGYNYDSYVLEKQWPNKALPVDEAKWSLISYWGTGYYEHPSNGHNIKTIASDLSLQDGLLLLRGCSAVGKRNMPPDYSFKESRHITGADRSVSLRVFQKATEYSYG